MRWHFFATEQYIDTVVEVRTVSDRVIVLKVLLEKIVPNVISASHHKRVEQMRRKEELWGFVS